MPCTLGRGAAVVLALLLRGAFPLADDGCQNGNALFAFADVPP
jgi:hypothetical protein